VSKKKKAVTENDESEHRLGVSVQVEDEGSGDEGGIDQHGLESGDEFYRLSLFNPLQRALLMLSRRHMHL